jgi:hypothetical protein
VKRYARGEVPRQVPRTKPTRSARVSALVVQWRSTAAKLLDASLALDAGLKEVMGANEYRTHRERMEAAAAQMVLCAEELEKALKEPDHG